MALNKNIIKINAERIGLIMKKDYQYSLAKLEEITSIRGTQLCLAILVLIQEKRVVQFLIEDGVRYALC